ncbi:MAG: zinc-ribbon domain-containing protein [Acetobacteraceae bacterium]|nr:zinc-ribbon domain-containing protein [Acetobacteraceae bacterium]
MHATCPACGTGYAIPDELAGRSLRCATCGEVFRPPREAAQPAAAQPGAEAAEPPPAEPAAAAADAAFAAAPASDPPAAGPPAAERLTVASVGSPSAAPRLAWAASLVVLAALLVALHAFRAEIAAAWPPMLRLYRALGLL